MRKILIFTIIFYCNLSYAEKNINQLISNESLNCSKDFFKTHKKREYSSSYNKAKLCADNTIENLAIWYILNKGTALKYDIANHFLINKNYYPNQYKLKLNTEKLLSRKNNNSEVLNFFADKKPTSYFGYKLYKKAVSEQNILEINDNILRVSNEYFMSPHFNFTISKKELTRIIKDIPKADLHKKIGNLISESNFKNAKKLFPYISSDYKNYFKARIALKRNLYKADRLNKINKQLLKKPDLYYDLARYYEKRNKDSKITPLILNLKKETDNKRWAQIRIRNSRYLLKQKRYEVAYKIVKNHNITSHNYELSELEWYSGWISLRFLNQPQIAIKHFKKMYNSVSYAISLSRSAYWLARSYQEAKQYDNAKIWYEIASNYNTTYYGQMAVLELDKEIMISLPKTPKYNIEELKNFLNNNELAKIALYFAANNHIKEAEIFFTHAIKNSNDPEKIKLIIELSNYTNNTQLINKISRVAMRFNVNSLANYPFLNNLPASNNIKENALIMSIIKQESGFNVSAISHAGAVGFMQLMPATAKDMAKRLKKPYSKVKLKNNAKYNIELGSGYIKLLLNKFEDSNILAIASYNAGPKNIKRWLNENGDPRKEIDRHKIIDWIEKISYQETRNYVQRILESTIIYLHLFRQKSHDFTDPVRKPA
ncbi:MAG: lytic transglycosylase domain-containing protein [Rickettsiales bacterium]|nr:lytic transglycosylase domain-containing protein [Rickettsiales bacterium]